VVASPAVLGWWASALRIGGGLAGLRPRGFAEQFEAALEALDLADGLFAVLAERGGEFLALAGVGELGQRVAELLLGAQQGHDARRLLPSAAPQRRGRETYSNP
jgi:hypothetical protein